MREPTDQAVASLVDEVTRHVLPAGLVEQVTTRRDVDHDGDPILRIDVVFDMDAHQLAGGEISRLLAELRTRLADRDESAFPIVSFMTPEEARSVAG